jgi:peptidoglycan hydrolase-like protein with peptidoglycan-binding domain
MTTVQTLLEDDVDGQALTTVMERRRRRRRGVLVGLVVLVVAAGATYLVARDRGARDKPSTAAVPTAFVTVKQGTLVARTSVSGTLTYAGTYKVLNLATGAMTYMPPVGRIISQGEVLYRVDEKPVVFFKGSVPMYRDLAQGMTGRDVKQLNAALLAAGYRADGSLQPGSNRYTRATASAVRDLQETLDLRPTGRLAKGDVVFVAVGRVRITSVSAQLGAQAPPGGSVMDASSINRQVTADVEASLQSRIKPGDTVRITLPNGTAGDGVVSGVGTVVTKGADGRSTINIKITPKGTASGSPDQAPVGVSITTDTVKSALMVPVNALLALLGGGYGIEVVDPAGTRQIVPVQLHLFDDTAGTVQITGAAVVAGQRVVVPTS